MTPGRRIVAPETVADYYRRGWWQDRTLLDDFLDRVSETPDAPAVVCDGETLSYGELTRRAGVLTAELRALGAGPETVVGLCLERSPEMVVALLGILGSLTGNLLCLQGIISILTDVCGHFLDTAGSLFGSSSLLCSTTGKDLRRVIHRLTPCSHI